MKIFLFKYCKVIPTNLQINGPEKKRLCLKVDAQGEIILHYKLVSCGLHPDDAGCIQTFNL